MVFVCTLLGACAQVLFKLGAASISGVGADLIVSVLTNYKLMGGLALYGINTMLLVLALREGELSVLYPVIALTYIWVTLISVWFFNESLHVGKVVGLALIVTGVAVLGRRGKREGNE